MYANAGHNPPVVIRRNGDVEAWDWPRPSPSESMKATSFRDFSLELAEGDKIFLYTDGVTEAEERRPTDVIPWNGC